MVLRKGRKVRIINPSSFSFNQEGEIVCINSKKKMFNVQVAIRGRKIWMNKADIGPRGKTRIKKPLSVN